VSSRPLRIAFFGLPLAACLLHADGHDLVLAAISRADAPGRGRLRRRLGGERVLLRPDVADPLLLERVREARPDLLVSWFWTTRLPSTLVEAARLGGIGAHPSLLPRHRGPDPTYHAILAGDRETGVTIHRIAAEYDTGAILAQARLSIDEQWDAYELAKALDRPSLRLLRDVVARLARGEHVAEREQDPTAATLAPFPEEDDLWIRWDRPTDAVLRQVRALAPSPGAVTDIGGRVVTVLAASPLERAPAVLEQPGEAAWLRGRAVVRTRDRAVSIDRFEVEGEPGTDDDLSALLGGS
jgi:methionyl-tRNA formyltransferase